MRDVDIANASTHLSRFNTFMRKAKRSTLVHELEAWRTRGFDAEDFVDFILKPGDTLPKAPTRADYIRFLASASPIMTGILKEIRDHVITGEKTKLLITKNVPVVAWFWKVVISLLQVRVTTIHSGLMQKERSRVSKEFNNSASSLSVFIIMYNVGGQGLNLHEVCWRVIVATPAINLAKQRVLQTRQVIQDLNTRAAALIKNSKTKESPL